MAQDFDTRGQVSLWKPDSTNEKAPAAKGTVVAHRDIKEGETIEIALWRNNSENPRAPLMKGKISDKREQGQNQGDSPAPSAEPDPDDSIPF